MPVPLRPTSDSTSDATCDSKSDSKPQSRSRSQSAFTSHPDSCSDSHSDPDSHRHSRSDKPRRRPRYRGTHPRRFEEKYKELDPSRFPEEAAKVRARGQTPAGTHVPVLLAEVLDVLRPRPGQVFLDGTLGGGGHAEAIAPRIAPGGIYIGLDLDAGQLASTVRRLEALGTTLRAHHLNFAGIVKALEEEGLTQVDGLLADLGASSLQIDIPERGFSFKNDGPLDMRMDRSRGVSAAEWLRAVDAESLTEALERWGEEPDARRVAAAVKAWARTTPGALKTRGLARTVLEAKGRGPRFRRESPFDPHPAARTFQAIRMAVNREEENLRGLLRTVPYVLAPGGRAAVITFHSVEDRIVEAAFEEGLRAGLYSSGNPSNEPLWPSAREIHSNSRARSAQLRWVERAG